MIFLKINRTTRLRRAFTEYIRDENMSGVALIYVWNPNEWVWPF